MDGWLADRRMGTALDIAMMTRRHTVVDARFLSGYNSGSGKRTNEGQEKDVDWKTARAASSRQSQTGDRCMPRQPACSSLTAVRPVKQRPPNEKKPHCGRDRHPGLVGWLAGLHTPSQSACNVVQSCNPPCWRVLRRLVCLPSCS